MAKPILVIKTSRHLSDEVYNTTHNKLKILLQDEYFILIVTCLEENEPKFEVFNADNVDEITFEQFKTEIKNIINANNESESPRG